MECKKGTQGIESSRIPNGRYKSESQSMVPQGKGWANEPKERTLQRMPNTV